MSALIHSIRIRRFLWFGITTLLLAATLPNIAQYAEGRVKIATHLAIIAVTVTDASGHAVANLTRHQFFVTDRNEPQQIEYFSREDAPQSVGIVLSRSVANIGAGSLSSLRQSVLRFKEQSNEKNEYFIIAGGGGPQLVTDWTGDDEVLLGGLDRAASADGGRGSAIYDSCAAAFEKLDKRESLRSVIVLITDGKDMTSWLSYTDLRKALNRSNAVVYSICLGDRRTPVTGVTAQSDLKKLSDRSGGASYVVSSATEVAGVLEKIATELRHQYIIGYYPLETKRDGSWHRVKVMAFPDSDDLVEAGPLVARSRSGYRALREESAVSQ